MSDRKGRERLLEIDRAKGLGIALVVWGHMAGVSTPGLPTWFYLSVAFIYQFHMPFFMYLSGFTFFLVGAPDRFWTAPGTNVWRRFDRLLVPFAAFGLLIVAGKYLAAALGPIDDGVGSLGDGVWKIATNASDNPVVSIWYLLVLFTYSIATPVLWRLGGRRWTLLLAVAGLGWIAPLPDAFYLKRIGIYFVFFVVGGLTAARREAVLPLFRRGWPVAALALAIASWLLLGEAVALLICGLLAIPALHGLLRLKLWDGDRLLLTLGRYSMAIYLLNTIFIGVTKVGWTRALPYQGGWFLPFAALLFVAGLIGPMIVRRVVAAIPPLAPIGRYLD